MWNLIECTIVTIGIGDSGKPFRLVKLCTVPLVLVLSITMVFCNQVGMETLDSRLQSIAQTRSFFKLALTRSRSSIAILCVVSFCTLWLGLDATRLWDRDEPRNARCAIEMLERADWVVPMFNDQLRTHKPILLYWMQMACYTVFGETDFAARAASAFMASLAVFATYWLARKLIDAQAGFWSAAVLVTSLMFVVAGRAATPDACLVATSAIGILGLVLHWQSASTRLTAYAAAGYIALGLAILAKGPVGIVLPMIVVGLWGLCQVIQASESPLGSASLYSMFRFAQFRTVGVRFLQLCWKVTRRLCVVRGLLIAVAVAAPWYIWVGIRTDGEWLTGFFFEHNLGRAMAAMEGHRGGWWFYPAASLVGLFPWSLMLLPICLWTAKHFRKKQFSPAIQLGLIWMGVYMAIFTIARTKLPSYITPSYPGAALLVGGFLSQWARQQWVLSNRWLRVAAVVFSLTAIVIMSAIAFLAFREQMPKIFPHLLWSVGFLGVAFLLFHASRHGHQHRLPWAMLATATIFLAGLFAAAGPAAGRYRSDLQAIMSQQTTVDEQGVSRRTEWLSLRAIEPSWVYYLKTPIAELSNIRTNSTQLSDSTLKQVAEHLRKPFARLIIDAKETSEIERMLAEQYKLTTCQAVAFKSFLKSNEIVVLQSTTEKLASVKDDVVR